MFRIVAVAALTLVACGHAPAVKTTDALPLRRVVVYRNGVAYFERAGKVDADTVEFSVRPEHVSDFLATLSVMESGGSSVRSAAFPIGHEEVEAPAGEASRALKKVVLQLDGASHELQVGYVSEQPVWRPTYRVVFEGDKPTLQAWGIVQNVSGEEWKNVRLSLVAGAPIAFEATLATPVIPPRPVVTDSGELIAAVPQSETQLAPPPPMAPPPAPRPAPEATPMEEEEAAPRAPGAPAAPPAPRAARRSRAAAPPKMDAYAPAPPPSSAPRNLALLASAQVQAGATRYDLPNTVTVPDGSATMVLLLSREVPGERVFLFAPDAGVPASAQHPFRVVRFRNDTKGLLERGPIAVFEQGSFLGQGLLEPLAAGAQTTVPFALERAVAVDANRRSEWLAARLARIEAGQLFIERDESLKTTWRVRNGTDAEAKVVLKHPRNAGMRLHAAPKGTDERVGEGNALVPVTVGANATLESVVDERRASQTYVDWMSPYAEEAVKAYFADARVDAKDLAALRAAWDLREKLRKASDEYQKVSTEQNTLQNAAAQTRESLRALGKAANVADLRQKLGTRLGELEERLAGLTQRRVDLELELNELRVRFSEATRELRIEAPPPKPAE